MINLWIIICLSAVNFYFVHSFTSIPLGTYRNNHLQTHLVVIKSLTQPFSGSYTSINVPFRQSKVGILTPQNLLFGIVDIDYRVTQISAGVRSMHFFQHLASVTQSSVSIRIVDVHQSLIMLKSSIMVMSNQYQYFNLMEMYTKTYNTTNNYRHNILLRQSQYPTVLYYLCGANLKTTTSIGTFFYQFNLTVNMVSSPTLLQSQVIIYAGIDAGAFISLNILVYYPALFNLYPEVSISLGYLYYSEFQTTYNVKTLTVQKLITNSEVFYGISAFAYDGSAFLQPKFKLLIKHSSQNQLYFQIVNSVKMFYYKVFVINHYTCNVGKHYIFSFNASSGFHECYDQCAALNHYPEFDISKRMHICHICLASCAQCQNASACTSCFTGYILAENNECHLLPTYYLPVLTSANAELCTSKSTLCQTCFIDGLYCLSCTKNAYANYSISLTLTATSLFGNHNLNAIAVDCKACEDNFDNCLSCNQTMCFTCKPGYYLQNFNNCTDNPLPPYVIVDIKPCSDTLKCQFCFQSNLDNCLKCINPLHRIIQGKCVNPCGDGIILDEEVCDDGNNLSFDGCSSDCLSQEDNWTCQLSPLGHSKCQYSQPMTLETVSIKKALRENKVTILMKNNHPFIREWMSFNSSELKDIVNLRVPEFEKNQNVYNFNYTVRFVRMPTKISALNPLRLLQTPQDPFDPELYQCLQIELTYFSEHPNSMSLNHQKIVVTLSPQSSNRAAFHLTPAIDNQFKLISDDNTLIHYFSPSYYESYGIIKTVSMIASFFVLAILLISFVACILDGNNSRQILLAIETAGIVQFTYFSLMGIGELSPLFVAMTEGLKLSFGFDIILSERQITEKLLIGVGIKSTNVMDNVNVSLGIVFLLLVTGLGVIFIGKIKNRKNNRADQDPADYPQVLDLQDLKEGQNQPNKPQDLETQAKMRRWFKTIIANFSFGLFLFFLYEFSVFSAIQLKFGLMQSMDTVFIVLIGVLLLTFTLLLFVKFDLFDLMTEKLCNYEIIEEKEKRLDSKDDKDGSLHIAARKRRQRIYILFLIVERIVNSLSVILLFKLISYHGLIPLLMLIGQIVYVNFYDKNVYNPPNKYRLYLNCLMGITIQGLLLGKNIMDANVETGRENSDVSEYLPFNILGLLFIVLLVGLSFQIYSIQKIRCIRLEIQWESANQNRIKQIRFRQNKNKQQLLDTNLNSLKSFPQARQCQDKRIMADSQFDQTQRNIFPKSNQKNYPQIQSSNNQREQLNDNQLIEDTRRNEEDDSELKTEKKFNGGKNQEQKNDFVTLKKQDISNPLISKNEIKKDIQKKLKEYKLPKSSKEDSSRKTSSLRKPFEGDDQKDRLKKNVNAPYRYTNPYCYNVYEIYDQI